MGLKRLANSSVSWHFHCLSSPPSLNWQANDSSGSTCWGRKCPGPHVEGGDVGPLCFCWGEAGLWGSAGTHNSWACEHVQCHRVIRVTISDKQGRGSCFTILRGYCSVATTAADGISKLSKRQMALTQTNTTHFLEWHLLSRVWARTTDTQAYCVEEGQCFTATVASSFLSA